MIVGYLRVTEGTEPGHSSGLPAILYSIRDVWVEGGHVVRLLSAVPVYCRSRLILSQVMEAEDDRPIRPGDLVVITSAFDLGSVMEDVPPGLVLDVRMGIPSTGGPETEETEVCSILWRGFVDYWVDVEWLGRVVDGGDVVVRQSAGRHEDELESSKRAQGEDDQCQ